MLVAASVAIAQPRDPHAVQPERPTVATHAGTVAPGWFEFETGVERDQSDHSASVFSTPTVFKFGVAPRAQLSLGGTIVNNDAGTGTGDLFVGVKVRLLEDAPIVGDFAILPSITFPTGSANRGFGSGKRQGALLFISSHQFGDVSMDINLGYDAPHGWPQHDALWTASFGGPIRGRLGWTLESFGFNDEIGRRAALLGGPTYQPAKWLSFDTGLIVPLHGPQPHALYAGTVCNVGRFLPARLTR
jgi:outer membrane putative beta-barrel porin/alpha-amylase